MRMTRVRAIALCAAGLVAGCAGGYGPGYGRGPGTMGNGMMGEPWTREQRLEHWRRMEGGGYGPGMPMGPHGGPAGTWTREQRLEHWRRMQGSDSAYPATPRGTSPWSLLGDYESRWEPEPEPTEPPAPPGARTTERGFQPQAPEQGGLTAEERWERRERLLEQGSDAGAQEPRWGDDGRPLPPLPPSARPLDPFTEK